MFSLRRIWWVTGKVSGKESSLKGGGGKAAKHCVGCSVRVCRSKHSPRQFRKGRGSGMGRSGGASKDGCVAREACGRRGQRASVCMLNGRLNGRDVRIGTRRPSRDTLPPSAGRGNARAHHTETRSCVVSCWVRGRLPRSNGSTLCVLLDAQCLTWAHGSGGCCAWRRPAGPSRRAAGTTWAWSRRSPASPCRAGRTRRSRASRGRTRRASTRALR